MNRRLAVALLLIVFVPFLTDAQVRTWVSGTGIDNATCSRAEPCRTFGAAITAVQAGGEVVVADSAGYGPVTISKSVAIIAPAGLHAAIVPTTGNAITVAASATDRVVIRGLSLTGLPGVTGIQASSFESLFIEHCVTDGFTNHGIQAAVSADAKIFVRDTVVRNASLSGMEIITSAGTVRGWVSRSRFDNNGHAAPGSAAGVMAAYGSNVVCSGCEANSNGFAGFRVFAHGGAGESGLPAELNCDHCSANGNQIGFYVEGQADELALLRLSRSFVTGNSYSGVQESQTSAVYVLSGTNVIDGNLTNKIGTFDPLPPDHP